MFVEKDYLCKMKHSEQGSPIQDAYCREIS